MPRRVLINSAGSAIRLLMLFMNQTIIAQSVNSIRQQVYLPTSYLADCFLASLYNG